MSSRNFSGIGTSRKRKVTKIQLSPLTVTISKGKDRLSNIFSGPIRCFICFRVAKTSILRISQKLGRDVPTEGIYILLFYFGMLTHGDYFLWMLCSLNMGLHEPSLWSLRQKRAQDMPRYRMFKRTGAGDMLYLEGSILPMCWSCQDCHNGSLLASKYPMIQDDTRATYLVGTSLYLGTSTFNELWLYFLSVLKPCKSLK